ncbi:MAG: tetratricopeptide repeat protein, partial [Actinobacteria bacterium]|nr:tetratricopeptide repeat protein [Actinomycetota bacterium]
RLNDRFDLLRKGGPSALAHHQTLEAALDWSHELLSQPERALLRRLSVFAGGFEPRAVAGICAGGQVKKGQVGELLARLVAKSLLVAEQNGAPQARYRLLETIRAYAAERLEEGGETAALRGAHARFYLGLAEEAEPELTGARQELWFERLETECANLRAAIEWSLGHGETEQALRLAGALVLFWRVRCHFSEGRDLLEAVVSGLDSGPPTLRAKALWGLGFMVFMTGDIDPAAAILDRSLSEFRELGDRQGSARALLLLGNCAMYRRQENAGSLLEESAAEARGAGDSWCLAHALALAGLDRWYRHEISAARRLFEECIAVARGAKDRQSLHWGLKGLGSVALRQGDFADARTLLEEAVAVTANLGENYSRAMALGDLAQLDRAQGEYGRARARLEDAVGVLHDVGHLVAVPNVLADLGRVRHAEGQPGHARQLFEEALAVAEAERGTPIPALLGLGELTSDEGDAGTARALVEEALRLARAGRDEHYT